MWYKLIEGSNELREKTSSNWSNKDRQEERKRNRKIRTMKKYNKMVEMDQNLSVIKINTNKVYFLQIKYNNCKTRF